MVIGYNVSLRVDNNSRANLLSLCGRHLEFDDGRLYLRNRRLLLSRNRRAVGRRGGCCDYPCRGRGSTTCTVASKL